jgi:hypothetical protein
LNKPKSYTNVLCIGCSHASKKFTKRPWPYWISQSIGFNVDVLSSPGAGIQIGVDKLVLQLSKKEYDLVLFQGPHDVRLSVGMNYHSDKDSSKEKDPWESHGNKVDAEFIMSLNPHNNVDAMKKFFGNDHSKLYQGFNNWYTRFVCDNNYETKVRYLHNLFLVQEICKRHGIKYKIFLWHKLEATPTDVFSAWYDQLDQDYIIQESVEEFLLRTKMKKDSWVSDEYSVDKYHLNDKGSKLLVQDYIIPQLG